MEPKLAFIVTGMGRSGTTWLSRLLNNEDRLPVFHEALARWDVRHYWKVPMGKMTAAQFVDARRLRMRNSALPRKYGDVNSYLRYVASEIGEAVGAPVAGLIRDGQWTVRSLMVRGSYQRKNYPPINAPAEYETPFEKCCWYWADTYERLEAAGIPIWTLEDLAGSYNKVHELAAYLDIMPPDKGKWHHIRRQRMNRTRITDTSGPPIFSEIARAAFGRIAGAVQERYYA